MLKQSSYQRFPRMAQRPRIVIERVIKEHHLHAEDFFSHYRDAYLVKARRTAAERLYDLGYSASQIGRFLGRDHTTVLNYLPSGKQARANRHAAKTILRHLTESERRIVTDLAASQDLAPAELMAQWVRTRIAEMLS